MENATQEPAKIDPAKVVVVMTLEDANNQIAQVEGELETAKANVNRCEGALYNLRFFRDRAVQAKAAADLVDTINKAMAAAEVAPAPAPVPDEVATECAGEKNPSEAPPPVT